MRHQKRGYKLGRTQAHRQATLASLSSALIEHKRIRTTFTKAKALRQYVEPLLSRAKEDTTHNRRQVFRRLQNKEAIKVLFSEISEKIGDRPGGYTRIVKLGQRAGDGAEMAIIELVDFNESDAESTGTSRRRRTRRGGSGSGGGRRSKKKTEAASAAATTTTVETEDQVVGEPMEVGEKPTDTVEEPVADEVTEPVEARTEDTPEGVEEAEVTAEAETAEAEAPQAETEAPQAETDAPEAEAAEAETPAEEDAAAEPEAQADDTEDAEDKEK